MLPFVPLKTLLSIKGDELYSMLKRSYRLACRIHSSSMEECKESTHIFYVGQTWYVMDAARIALTSYALAQGYIESRFLTGK